MSWPRSTGLLTSFQNPSDNRSRVREGYDRGAYTYLFGLENTSAHTLMVAALTVVIAFVLFTTYTLDNLFAGDVRLGPDAFELVLHRFGANQK
jgi:hypothetical protein